MKSKVKILIPFILLVDNAVEVFLNEGNYFAWIAFLLCVIWLVLELATGRH